MSRAYEDSAEGARRVRLHHPTNVTVTLVGWCRRMGGVRRLTAPGRVRTVPATRRPAVILVGTGQDQHVRGVHHGRRQMATVWRSRDGRPRGAGDGTADGPAAVTATRQRRPDGRRRRPGNPGAEVDHGSAAPLGPERPAPIMHIMST